MAVVVLALCGPVGHASASPPGKPDLFTRQGIDQYLLSHGVNPATAVMQTGLLNYVGNACPGKGWHCLAPTTAPVVQLAPRGGVNVYHCSVRPARSSGCFVLQVNAGAAGGGAQQAAGSEKGGLPPGTNEYVCLQYADSDTADLDSSGCAMDQVNTTGDNDGAVGQLTLQKSTGTQSASETVGRAGDPLTQTNDSGNNRIIIGQVSQQKNSDTPTADQATTVSQFNGTGQNQAFVQQQVQQQVSDSAAVQDQEAQQLLCLAQDSPSGQNQATVGQQANQEEQDSAAGASQYQNQNHGPATFDCGVSRTYPYSNLVAEVLQDEETWSATGSNQEKVGQALQEQERSTASSGVAHQQQGSAASKDTLGGLEAVPDQDSAGVSQATTHQNEQQTMHAASAATQVQVDPIRQPPGLGLQESNPEDVFQLFQNGTQLAGPTAKQIYDLIGDCISSGTCDVQQTATSNAGSIHESCTKSKCENELTNKSKCENELTNKSNGKNELTNNQRPAAASLAALTRARRWPYPAGRVRGRCW